MTHSQRIKDTMLSNVQASTWLRTHVTLPCTLSLLWVFRTSGIHSPRDRLKHTSFRTVTEPHILNQLCYSARRITDPSLLHIASPFLQWRLRPLGLCSKGNEGPGVGFGKGVSCEGLHPGKMCGRAFQRPKVRLRGMKGCCQGLGWKEPEVRR